MTPSNHRLTRAAIRRTPPHGPHHDDPVWQTPDKDISIFPTMTDVCVITLQLDSASQAFFQGLRDKYFPAHKNVVPAHVTLFHAVPSSICTQVESDLEIVTRIKSFGIDVTGLRFMGFGVMYELHSEKLKGVHTSLQQKWLEHLTRQDSQRYQPHIVIQNKSSPEDARQTLATLSSDFKPFKVTAQSILMWTYLGGPWRLERQFDFESDATWNSDQTIANAGIHHPP